MTLQFDGTNDPVVYRSRAEACGDLIGLRSTFRDGRKVMVRRAERRRVHRYVRDGCLIGLITIAIVATLLAVGAML